ncbi:hypothetical protein BURPS1710A_0606 [Burkholderia pseudomallei 1710a]|uniref:Uncharacterized protein n=1 Tax=Burkholderia pseudomallei 1710a TaxID=320371 RepID=A0A0E1W3S5_BURPE|nr:hypothetical protein BURPS1710A_0606 [Burkholderia pseudomallei 1710a]
MPVEAILGGLAAACSVFLKRILQSVAPLPTNARRLPRTVPPDACPRRPLRSPAPPCAARSSSPTARFCRR